MPILLLGNKHSTEVLIKSLAQNWFTQGLSMGKLLLKANECIEYIDRNEDEFGKKYEISILCFKVATSGSNIAPYYLVSAKSQ